jgi:hypothetical protein
MDELQALQHQLEEARDEAELNLLQLQQVQEELEFYFLRCQELDRDLGAIKEADVLKSQTAAESEQAAQNEQTGQKEQASESAEISEALERSQAQLGELQRHRKEEQQLLSTAQAMLEGQARYLEDVSLREEKAAQALDRLRLLEAEILYYLRHSKPSPQLNPKKINRLIQLAKQPNPVGS